MSRNLGSSAFTCGAQPVKYPCQYDLCSYSNTNCPDVLQQWPEHSFCLPGNECNEVQVTEKLCKFMSSENDRAETRTPVPRFQGPYSSIVEELPLPAPPLAALHLGSPASVLFTSSMLSPLNGYFSSTLDSRPPPAPFAYYLLIPSAFSTSMFFLGTCIASHSLTISSRWWTFHWLSSPPLELMDLGVWQT